MYQQICSNLFKDEITYKLSLTNRIYIHLTVQTND